MACKILAIFVKPQVEKLYYFNFASMSITKNTTKASLFLILLALVAFTKINTNKATAEVNYSNGFYVFSDCKPLANHDTLGTVDLGFVSGTQYETIKSNLLKRARKFYPQADGAILKLNTKQIDQCIVIKFKN